MSLGMELGLGPGMGTPLPSAKGGGAEPPPPTKKNSTHVYCGQTAGWMKLVLGMEVGLSPGDFVLDGDPAPFPKRGAKLPQIFGPCLMRPNGWVDEAGTWHGGRPQPSRFCVRWGPSPPPPKGGYAPNFLPISILAKRLDASRFHLVWM